MANSGEILTQLRKIKGDTQEDLRMKTGYSRSLIASWESGKTVPHWEQINKICGVLDINIENVSELFQVEIDYSFWMVVLERYQTEGVKICQEIASKAFENCFIHEANEDLRDIIKIAINKCQKEDSKENRHNIPLYHYALKLYDNFINGVVKDYRCLYLTDPIQIPLFHEKTEHVINQYIADGLIEEKVTIENGEKEYRVKRTRFIAANNYEILGKIVYETASSIKAAEE